MQAPRRCEWKDIQSFFEGKPSYNEFRKLIDQCAVPSPNQPDSLVEKPNSFFLNLIKYHYGTFLQFRRRDDEHVLMPFIVSVLSSAAYPDFIVVPAPIVCPPLSEMLSDVAILAVQDHLEYRVLLEVKGSLVYPCDLGGERASRNVAQLFQQVAMAFVSGLWTKPLLCGLVTSHEWNFFLVDCVCMRQPILLRIKEFHAFRVDEQRLDESISIIVQFIHAHLQGGISSQ